jgi:hypothetical protein
MDARGRLLRSSLALSGNRVLLRVRDRSAVFPLRIDPLIQAGQLVVSGSGEEGDEVTSVVTSGDTVFAGAQPTGGTSTGSGAVAVYTEPAAGWSTEAQAAELYALGLGTDSQFGQNIAASGSTVVVGVGGSGAESGGAFVYTEPAGGWSGLLAPSAELIPSAALDGNSPTVAVSGSTVVLDGSEPGGPADQYNIRGEVYVYTAPTGGWTGMIHPSATLTAAHGTMLYAATAIGISGSTVIASGYRAQHPCR